MSEVPLQGQGDAQDTHAPLLGRDFEREWGGACVVGSTVPAVSPTLGLNPTGYGHPSGANAPDMRNQST